jgi:hypothetical protein
VLPGWYPDPYGADTLRYWDGQGWTEYEFATAVPISTPNPPNESARLAASKRRRDRSLIALGVIAGVAVFVVIGAGMLLASPEVIARFFNHRGVPPGSGPVPAPLFEPTLLRNEVVTPSRVTSFISVMNVGDKAGKWACTVVLRNADGAELGRGRFVAKTPLLVGKSVNDFGPIALKAGTATSVDGATSAITCH